MTDLPSVTTILKAAGLGPDFSMIDPGTLERARVRGAAVHEAIEADHLKYEIEPLPGAWMPYLEAYRRFVKESSYKPECAEFRVESARWRYCGHPDTLGWLLGKRALLDLKVMEHVALPPVARQLAGYRIAIEEARPEQRVDLTAALGLRADGTYRLEEVDTRGEAESEFLAAVVIFHARRRDVHGR